MKPQMVSQHWRTSQQPAFVVLEKLLLLLRVFVTLQASQQFLPLLENDVAFHMDSPPTSLPFLLFNL
jgi:hypothetical protein